MSVDEEIKQLDDELNNIVFSFSDTFHMSESTTAEELQTWLDSLELSNMQFSVKRFRNLDKHPIAKESNSGLWFKDYLFMCDSMPEGIMDRVQPWRPVEAVAFEEEEEIIPRIEAEFEEDAKGKLVPRDSKQGIWVDNAFKLTDLEPDALEQSGDEDSDLAPGVFAIMESVCGFAIPVTAKSVIRFRSERDGIHNRITARSSQLDEQIMRRFPSYYADQPIDVREAQRYAQEMEAILTKIINDGLNPSPYLDQLESQHELPMEHQRSNQ